MEVRLLFDHRQDLVAEPTRAVPAFDAIGSPLCPELEKS